MLGLVGDILGVLLVAGIAAVSGWTARRVVRSVGRAPVRHALIRIVEAGMHATAVAGPITSPATVRGAVTGTPCALATTSVTATDPDQHPDWPRPRTLSAAAPGRFAVAEHVLLPGDLIHLASDPLHDPRQQPRFHLSHGGRGATAAGLGILTYLLMPVLLFGVVCAGVVAYQLITG